MVFHRFRFVIRRVLSDRGSLSIFLFAETHILTRVSHFEFVLGSQPKSEMKVMGVVLSVTMKTRATFHNLSVPVFSHLANLTTSNNSQISRQSMTIIANTSTPNMSDNGSVTSLGNQEHGVACRQHTNSDDETTSNISLEEVSSGAGAPKRLVRKREREKLRRNHMKDLYDKLMTVLLKVDPDLQSKLQVRRQRLHFAKTGEDQPLQQLATDESGVVVVDDDYSVKFSRLELLNQACEALERMHTEKLDRETRSTTKQGPKKQGVAGWLGPQNPGDINHHRCDRSDDSGTARAVATGTENKKVRL
mmetsp:Transcript_663/g.1547  ORF Transcript_663/g.1547 Transcript_663/m.1547 type:complete len:305 (+) Transcript_663:250-1164(+)